MALILGGNYEIWFHCRCIVVLMELQDFVLSLGPMYYSLPFK